MNRNTTSTIEHLFAQSESVFSVDAKTLDISKDEILRGLGMKPSDADEYLLQLIERQLDEARLMLEPSAGYVISPDFLVNKGAHIIQIEGRVFDTHKQVTSLLAKSKYLVLFACTIGDKLEKEAKKQMAAGNSLEGYIFDLIGSEFAECVAEKLHNEIEKQAAIYTLKVSNRYSPGYCNWPVSDQHKLFLLLGNANCGIRLTDSSLMLPVKSVSGLLGVGENMRRVKYKCDLCTDKDCIMRKK